MSVWDGPISLLGINRMFMRCPKSLSKRRVLGAQITSWDTIVLRKRYAFLDVF